MKESGLFPPAPIFKPMTTLYQYRLPFSGMTYLRDRVIEDEACFITAVFHIKTKS